MNFCFIIDQLYKKHTVLFKKALPESFYSQSIPVAEKGNMFLFTCSEYLKVAFTSEPAEGVFLFFKILFMLGMTLRLPH